MNIDELVEKLRGIVREELQAEREHTKLVVRDEVQAAKQEIMATIEKEAETMADFFHETWAKMEATTERVTSIEEHVGLTEPPKKN